MTYIRLPLDRHMSMPHDPASRSSEVIYCENSLVPGILALHIWPRGTLVQDLNEQHSRHCLQMTSCFFLHINRDAGIWRAAETARTRSWRLYPSERRCRTFSSSSGDSEANASAEKSKSSELETPKSSCSLGLAYVLNTEVEIASTILLPIDLNWAPDPMPTP